MLCDSVWLLAIVHNELWYENGFLQIQHLILWTTFPALFLVSIFNGRSCLCGSSWNKLRTPEHRVRFSFLPESAHMWGCTVAEHCEAPGTSYASSRSANKSSMEPRHGFKPPRSSRNRSPNISSSIGAIESSVAIDNNTADKYPSVSWRFWRFASFSTPSPSTFSHLLCVSHVLCSSAMHEHVAKLVATVFFLLTAAKTVLQRNLLVVLGQLATKLAISKQILMGKAQNQPWTALIDSWTIVHKRKTEERWCEKRGKTGCNREWHEIRIFLTGLNEPFLPIKACLYRFQPFFVRTGVLFNKNGWQNSGGMGQDMTAFRSMFVYGFW